MTLTIDDGFVPLLAEFDLDTLDAEPGTVIGMWPDSRIALFNPRYVQFAENNGGGESFLARWGLGRKVLDAVPEHLMEFYTTAHAQVHATGRMYEHQYRCPTPQQQQRFRLRIYPLGNSEGLLAIHTLFWAGPHEVVGDGVKGADCYKSQQGLVVQCSSCRHVRRTDKPNQWDYVFEYVAKAPSRTSYGLCPVCLPEYAWRPPEPPGHKE